MNVIVNLLFMFLGSETFKTLVKKSTRKIVESKGISIDPDLATALLTDVAESNGNKLGKSLVSTIIKEL